MVEGGHPVMLRSREDAQNTAEAAWGAILDKGTLDGFGQNVRIGVIRTVSGQRRASRVGASKKCKGTHLRRNDRGRRAAGNPERRPICASHGGRYPPTFDEAARIRGHSQRHSLLVGFTLFAVITSNDANVYSLESGSLLAHLPAHTAIFEDAFFIPGSTNLLVVTMSGALQVWNIGRESVTRVQEASTRSADHRWGSIVIAPDRRVIAVLDSNGIEMRDAGTLAVRLKLTKKDWHTTEDPYLRGSVAISPDSRMVLAPVEEDGTDPHKLEFFTAMQLWDSQTGQPVARFPHGEDRERVDAFAFSNRDDLVAWATRMSDGDRKARVTVWDWRAKKQVTTIAGQSSVRFSSDGRSLATGGPGDTKISIYNTTTWQPTR